MRNREPYMTIQFFTSTVAGMEIPSIRVTRGPLQKSDEYYVRPDGCSFPNLESRIAGMRGVKKMDSSYHATTAEARYRLLGILSEKCTLNVMEV